MYLIALTSRKRNCKIHYSYAFYLAVHVIIIVIFYVEIVAYIIDNVFPIIDNSVAADKLRYGADKVDSNGNAVFDGTTDAWVVIVDELHNDANGDPKSLVRYVYPNCVPQEITFGTHSKGALIIDTVKFQALYDSTIGGYYKKLAPVSTTTTGA